MRTFRPVRLRWSALAILAAAILAGCDDNNTVLSPRFQPEVANNVDNFQFQATGVTGVTQALTYTWRNTGGQATVDQSCSITGGSATLALFDSTGTQVYSRNLAENGSFASGLGAPGTWTIRLSAFQVRGTLNFRVQKKT